MKNLITICALFLLSISSLSAQETKGITISVTVENAKSDNGNILVDVHTEETFMRTKGFDSAESKIENGKATFTFSNVKPGEYAIMVLHDENENYKLDFESNGMPKESYGVSNNPMSYGPPQFNEAKFTVEDKDLNLIIRF